MNITISGEEFSALSRAAREEILALVTKPKRAANAASYEAPEAGPEYAGIELEGVADLTFRQVQTWMEAASDKTKLGLRVIAEQGPAIKAQALLDAGIENLPHFQSRTTIRTRTVTGEKGVFLLGWDDWTEVDEGEGRYAVTPITYQSLRRYFQLD